MALGAGEILLTSVDNEGLQQGMDLELIEAVTKAVNVPVICGGGVGCGDDIVDAANAGADAVACAAVLHYKKETVTELKEEMGHKLVVKKGNGGSQVHWEIED